MKYLVTGATGFIGRELCLRLDMLGADYVAISSDGRPLASGVSTVGVNLLSDEVGSHLLDGVDTVFHLAGIAHQRAKSGDYERLNHRATLALAAASAAAGVTRFIFVSSVKAMGTAVGTAMRAEEQCEAPVDDYGKSKRQTELGLHQRYAHSPMSVLIVRPSLVYAGEAVGNLAFMARAVRRGLPRPPAMGGRSMIARDDLIDILWLLSSSSLSGCHLWIACDGRQYSSRDIYDLMRAAAGKRPGITWAPLWLWCIGCRVLDILFAQPGGSHYDKILGTELYSHQALTRDTGWQPTRQLTQYMPLIMGSTVGSEQVTKQ